MILTHPAPTLDELLAHLLAATLRIDAARARDARGWEWLDQGRAR